MLRHIHSNHDLYANNIWQVAEQCGHAVRDAIESWSVESKAIKRLSLISLAGRKEDVLAKYPDSIDQCW